MATETAHSMKNDLRRCTAEQNALELKLKTTRDELEEIVDQFDILHHNEGKARAFNLLGQLFFKKQQWKKSEEYYVNQKSIKEDLETLLWVSVLMLIKIKMTLRV